MFLYNRVKFNYLNIACFQHSHPTEESNLPWGLGGEGRDF